MGNANEGRVGTYIASLEHPVEGQDHHQRLDVSLGQVSTSREHDGLQFLVLAHEAAPQDEPPVPVVGQANDVLHEPGQEPPPELNPVHVAVEEALHQAVAACGGEASSHASISCKLGK
jgi:hypothetical protein